MNDPRPEGSHGKPHRDMTLQWDPGTGGDTARVDVTFRRSQYAVTYHTDTSVGHVGRGGRAGAYLIAFDRQGKGGGSTSDISAPMSRPSRRASSTTPKAAILRMLSGSGGGEEATDRPRRQGDQVEGKIFRGRGRHVGLAARRLSERCEVLD
jgi:hypothetical protein